ncbi:MAG: hypothetical protein QMB22_01515 [Dehalococcoidia bacterium]|jgi:sulfopyruvate decarboxylase subunit alpha|nr:MAG: sulfopyruvate decarboxylase subunit beta [Chloroflexota bacterium]|tara:strand:- start:353 stop:859 length:507 start_codon:yes stop_codon:yes gene_type:complete
MKQLVGKEIISALAASNIEYILSLPDITTSEHVLKPLFKDKRFQVIQVCKEDEAISISAGLYAAGKKSVILIQHTGLLDSINSLRAVSMEIQNPSVFLVGLLRHKSGFDPNNSERYGIKIMQSILTAMDTSFTYIDKNGQEPSIIPIINNAYNNAQPHVVLIGGVPQE